MWFVAISSVLKTSLFQGHANGTLAEFYPNMKDLKDLVLIEVSPKLSKEQRLVVQNNALNVMRNNKITKNFKFAIVSKVAECGCASVMM